jgi:hypothetical protein
MHMNALQDSVHRLTREHLATDKNGILRVTPALLAELRLALTPGRNSSGNGGSEGAPIPIDPTALDMLRDIEEEARKDYAEATGSAWHGELEALLQSYPHAQITAEWETYLARVVLGWVDTITAYLWPVKPRRKLVGKVCPSCGSATYGEERKTCLSLGCWDSEGGMKKIGDWDIECASCEAGWSGEQVGWLLTALDAKEDERMTA